MISVGNGPINVFLWSQMHGDESTATQALFDIFNFLNGDQFINEKQQILNSLTLHFLPMLNPDGADYLADGAIAVGESGLMLQHIMKEKYIHNFLNPETFVDFRRYDFSDEVFKGLSIREEEDSDGDYAGEWFRRATYPTTEEYTNPDNVAANKVTPVTPVWWDE
ncbi:M14 family zinc carboxypeptidase [Formosa sediminum]|uniref:M14 family zinc carboxypeptidase n=1 Tax=Formosa sediminum TaxID=2594004 RepID=UPI001FE59BE4|nr:M14 family zinc carboxypeptidase [Formosa sediminum]